MDRNAKSSHTSDNVFGLGWEGKGREGLHSCTCLVGRAHQYTINTRAHQNTINRAELAGILVAFQQGHTNITSDNASCLSQISKQTLKQMRVRTHLHVELIQAISDLLQHSPHPVHFY
eukprot:785952-Pelagomonas_calceolata.AAC.1